jgi:hypothetical protein
VLCTRLLLICCYQTTTGDWRTKPLQYIPDCKAQESVVYTYCDLNEKNGQCSVKKYVFPTLKIYSVQNVLICLCCGGC